MKTTASCLACILALACAPGARASERFEAAALVDSFDFAAVRDRAGRALFDTETPAGNRAVLDHVLLTGADTILWRNCSGALARYRSDEERFPPVESPLDKRRLPDSRPVHGWLRYHVATPDILADILGECRARGLRAGVHWPFEETHWASWTFGAWNLEHPQYWGATCDGKVWAGRCSLAYPEVASHKLRLADELLARGMDHLLIDTWRTGAWGPEYEYVRPEIERWRARFGDAPPRDPKDPRWCAFVSETTHAWFTALRARLAGSGRQVRLLVGVPEVGPIDGGPDTALLTRGVDWRRLVRERVIDALVIMSVNWDRARPMESTRSICREVIGLCAGRCQVLFPVTMYDFTRRGIPSYAAATGLDPSRVAADLLTMAWEEGADGIVMECVDHNNYPPATRAELRRLLDGPCKLKRALPKKGP